jgi:hypothetical protein
MQRLTEREVRFLCWKIKRGDRLPSFQLVQLLDALLTRLCEGQARYATNENKAPRGRGCPRRNFLFEKYQDCVKDWVQKVAVLGDRAGRRDPHYLDLWKEVIEARLKAKKAKAAYDAHKTEHEC